MTSSERKVRHDKEMSAMTYNLKEQRVLEKSLQTLQLEQSYAVKLLELDNRIIKVHYKKLKDKVSRIKSHLQADDISKFRQLDAQGKLKPSISGLSLSSAVKIAAASRRLNLNSSRSGASSRLTNRRAIKSALPRITVHPEANDPATKSTVSFTNKPPVVNYLRRSNSVTGVFIDAPDKSANAAARRPGSAFVPTAAPNGPNLVKEDSDLLSPRAPSTTPAMSVITKKESPSELADKDFMSPRGLSAHHHARSPFSSHTAAEKDARDGSNVTSARQERTRRLSHVSNDSIDSNLGENMFEERRQELLEEENVRAATLEKRTKLFLKDVDDYLTRNPPLQPSHVAFEKPPPSAPRKDSLNSKDPYADGKPKRFQRRVTKPDSFEESPTFFPEEKYKQRLLGLWKDMNKCRYLRLPDDRIDLSGINTLAKEQMKLFAALRNAERTPISEAWET